MTNPPKKKGTAFESAVVAHIQEHGFPARRVTLHGSADQGDIHVHDGASEDAFVRVRTERDATLSMPRLILPSLQVNMRAGHLPPANDDGRILLKVPVAAL